MQNIPWEEVFELTRLPAYQSALRPSKEARPAGCTELVLH